MSKAANPFRYFHSSPEVIRLVVMLYVRFPPSLRNVEDLLHERGIDLCHETVRLWWNRFGPMFAADIRRQRVSQMRGYRHWRWHLDEIHVRINGETHYLWRAVDHEGEILESYVTRKRDKSAALSFMKKALKRHGRPERIVTDGLRPIPPRCRISASASATRLASISITEPRTRTYRSGDENAPCCGFGRSARYKSLPPYTPRLPIISTPNAISSIVNLQNPPFCRID